MYKIQYRIPLRNKKTGKLQYFKWRNLGEDGFTGAIKYRTKLLAHMVLNGIYWNNNQCFRIIKIAK